MKVLLFGGSGLLGTTLSLKFDIITPSKSECNILDYFKLEKFIKKTNPDVIINAAAITDNRIVELDPTKAIQVNIIGAANLAIICSKIKVRLVYISTDYVYRGNRGNYKESDDVFPFNNYSHTKLGGECSTRLVKNHLIIRTSFGIEFKYKKAFVDKWTSKDYVGVIAPMIYEAAISPLTGVLNLGTERKTIYDYVYKTNQNVDPISIRDQRYFTPEDTSLNTQKWIDYKSENSVVSLHTNCRCCESTNMSKYLDLNLMPLANNLEFTSQRAKDQDRYPLQILFCNDCYLSQLSVVIEPKKMFSYYTYRSGINKPYVAHCRNMAKSLVEQYGIDGYTVHVDVAGNDGTLLLEFKDELINHKSINVDPASNLIAISESQGVESICDFWGEPVAKKIIEKHGKIDLITATNVFAHVPDVHGFLKAAEMSLSDNGVMIIECPYIVDFIENIEFDTTYYEHLSYMSVYPVWKMCEQNGLRLFHVEKINIHGGTIRMHITKQSNAKKTGVSVIKFIANEKAKGFHDFNLYKGWSEKVDALVDEFKITILDLKKQGKKIAAFGASAKGNTLLNYSSVNTDIINFIVDQTPEKIGKFSPGTGIPILGMDAIEKENPDYIVILAWNFKDAIIEKLRKIYKGKFIIPIPKFEIID
jgi:2-polyprenyl-3-methyl-5-hydroxy-6-metoxy-1,4-benzoquinol methylase